MIYIYRILFFVFLSLSVQAQSVGVKTISFDTFLRDGMTSYPGVFPVYTDGKNYYLELSDSLLGKPILLIGDAPSAPGEIAKSSGFVSFQKNKLGTGLELLRSVHSEIVSGSQLEHKQRLVNASNNNPITSLLPIVAEGSKPGAVIINLTSTLMSGGDLLNYQNFYRLSRPDGNRSIVERVRGDHKSASFDLLWSQTDKNPNNGQDIPSTTPFHFSIFLMDTPDLPVRIADPRIGFKSFQVTDYGLYDHYAARVNLIHRWDLRSENINGISSADNRNIPKKPIRVMLDKAIPSHFRKYVREGVLAWEDAFRQAGITSVFAIEESNNEYEVMSPQTILIRWNNASPVKTTSIITEPTTGQIVAGKINISEVLLQELIPLYFSACGLSDIRITKDIRDIAVKGDLMRYQVSQLMADVLGLLPNPMGSHAYGIAQLRDAKWLRKNGISSSITDQVFNYVAQENDHVPVSTLMPQIGPYDRLAIKWAYSEDKIVEDSKIFIKDGKIDPIFFYNANSANSPWGRENTLSSDILSASKYGINNLRVLYPRLVKIVNEQKNPTEDWSDYLMLTNIVRQTYKQYVRDAASIIGGRMSLPIRKGYNNKRYLYTTAHQQREAMTFLKEEVFSDRSEWLNDTLLGQINGSNSTVFIQSTNSALLKELVSLSVIQSLLDQTEEGEQNQFTVQELFSSLEESIFMNFSDQTSVEPFHRSLQFDFIYGLLQSVKNNKTEPDSDPAKSMLLMYFDHLSNEISRLSKSHKDKLSRENYELINIYIKNSYGKN